MRKPLEIGGKKFSEASFEVNENSIYIELFDEDGNPSFHEIREDLSAAENDVEEALKGGNLPDGFDENYFK